MGKKAKAPKKSKIKLGIALFIMGAILLFGRLQAPTPTKSESFSNEPVIIEGFQLGEKKNLETPKKIVIPTVGIDLEVKEAKVVRGYWEVFADSAAWGEGSGYPGEPGNQVIFAHARVGLFLPVRELKGDELVYVLTKDKWYLYKVKEIREVYPNQIEVIAPTTDETLTLYTCSGYQDSKRLIVIAKRV